MPSMRGALRRGRRLAGPTVAFLDLNHDPKRTILLAGSARSGSTWLSEVLVDQLRCRFVFEPLRRDRVALARAVRFGQYAAPDREDPELARVVGRVLTGRVRSRWSDEYNSVRLARRRMVKEIRINNLLPWLVRRYPDTPVVYLLRHPVPSARSLAQLGWPDRLPDFFGQPELMAGPLAPMAATARHWAAEGDAFRRFVLRWCLENWVPLHRLGPVEAHVVFYEDLVADSARELERLGRYLGRFPSFAGTRWTPATLATALDRPSVTNYRHTDVAAGVARLSRWIDEEDAGAVADALGIVEAFGLGGLYGLGARPLVGPDAVLGSPPRAAPGP